MSRRETTRLFPVLLLEPNAENAPSLASLLDAAGFDAVICASGGSALQVLERTFFFALIVVADFTHQDCLVMLERLRRRAPRSWMIVAAPECDVPTCDLIHRHGGDACVALPIAMDDLTHRLHAFQRRARPAF